MRHILKCKICNEYTMGSLCRLCGRTTFSPRPAKFSPEDKYGEYRRKAKRLIFEEHRDN